MANDGGLVAKLEQWLADTLAALTYGDDDALVFKTADVWKHQVAATEGGVEAGDRFAPFAFASYQSGNSAREGDNDLRQIPTFAILIGVTSKENGVARFGDATHLGISKIRDLIINALDKKRPDGTDITCDEFYYMEEIEILDQPKRHWIQMNFEVSQITVPEN
jgi:hypothetical protein